MSHPDQRGAQAPPSAAGRDEILAAVSQIVERLVPAGGRIDADTRLLDDGLALDSILVLEIILALEERFSCRIDALELHAENLATVARLAALVERSTRAGEPGSD